MPPLKKIKAGGKDLITKGPPPLTLPPKTTEQEDMVTAGQRAVNLLWETTQARIALVVIFVGMFVNASLICVLVISNRDISVNRLAVISIALQFINLTAGIIIGFYFSRTNHTNIGGVGKKATAHQNYEGR